MKFEKIKEFFSKRAVRTISIFVAVLLIGVAVYVNYRLFYDPVSNMGYGDNNMEDNYDSSLEVGADESADYFASVVLNRQTSRDEALDALKMVSESEEASDVAREAANLEIAKIADDIQNEANIETLVKAKGYEDCVAVISGDSVSVIVGAEELMAADAAAIFTIVYETTGRDPENISIISRA